MSDLLRIEDQQTTNRSLRHVWMPRMQGAFERFEPVIEYGHVSGLFLCGHSICRWPVWRCVDQVQISVASSRALYVSLVFPIPISSIVWSLLFSSSSHHADCTVILPVRPELQNPPDASSLPKLRARSCWQARSPQAYEASAQAYVPAKSPWARHSLSPSVCGSWRL